MPRRVRNRLLVSLCVAICLSVAAPAQAGLIGYWDFNTDVGPGGTVPEYSGTYPGALVGNSYTSGGALVLNPGSGGPTGYLQLPAMHVGHFGGQEATLSMWVKLDQAVPSDQAKTGFVALSTAGLNSHYTWTDGLAYMNVFRSDRVETITLRPDVDRTQWHHIAVVTKPGAGEWRLYQGGQEIRTANPSFGFGASPRIGRSEAGFYLVGQVDDAAILDHALTAAQVQGLANKTLTVLDVIATSPGGIGTIGTVTVAAGKKNIATSGTATQISTNYGGLAPRAIDGNTDGNYWNGSVTHTNEGSFQPWWQVDLGSPQQFSEIMLWNRTDGVPQRLTNFRVSVRDAAQTELWGQDYFTGGGYPNPSLDILLGPTAGQIVRVQKYADGTHGSDDCLSLAEVQIFGYDPGDYTMKPADVWLMELDAASHTNDRFNIAGQLTLAGSLRVAILNGVLEGGEVFDLFDFGSRAGSFSQITLPTLTGSLQWDTSMLYTDGTLRVTIPEPATLALLALGSLALTRRRTVRR